MTAMTQAQLERLKRDVARCEPLHSEMSVDIAELKQLIAAAEELAQLDIVIRQMAKDAIESAKGIPSSERIQISVDRLQSFLNQTS